MSGLFKRITPDSFRNRVFDRQGKLGKDACKIMASAINAVDPYVCIENHVKYNGQTLDLGGNRIFTKDIDRIFVIGLGKASVPMAISVIDAIGEMIDFAAVVTKSPAFQEFDGYKEKLKVFLGGHHIPTEASIESTKSILGILPELKSKDLVIVLISGGGSALFTSPVGSVSLDDIQKMTENLLKSGAEIKEINTIRKHLDEVKGGRLALRLHPAKIFTLILSDVVGDRLDMIASGPTVPDPTYYKDALEIITRYHFEEKIPQAIISYLEDGNKGKYPETLKSENNKEISVKNILVGSNYQAAEAGFQKARSMGYRSLIISTHLTGDTHHSANFLSGIIKSTISHSIPLKRPACLILGGETTVKVTGSGRGGRNQDLALRMVETLSGIPGVLFISLASDGEDGPTNAAGAVIDDLVFTEDAKEETSEVTSYIKNNNSYDYLDQKGALIRIGSTGTNVNDLIIILFQHP